MDVPVGRSDVSCRRRRGKPCEAIVMPDMHARALDQPRTPLVMREKSIPAPGPGEVLVEIGACAVCRTDLHVVDGELPNPKLPIIPGHEIVGRIAALGRGAGDFALGA